MANLNSRRAKGSFVASLAVALVAIAFLFGGASRPDVAGPIVVRMAAILVLTALVVRGKLGLGAWSRTEKVVWVILFCVPLLQLVPLPWSVWTRLPAREYPRELFMLLGLTPWQPITLVPDRTWNAFAALFPALAAFALGRQIDEPGLRRVWSVILLIAVLSGLLGILQVLDGPGSRLRLYAITNTDAAVGLFSNANHNALLLASAIPALALWIDSYRQPNEQMPTAVWVAAAAGAAVILVGLLLTLSRAGVAFGLLSSVLTAWLVRPKAPVRWPARRAPLLAALAAAIGLMLFAGSAAVENYFGLGQAEGRLENLPYLMAMIRDSFPVGTGMGSLDTMFRGYEAVERLKFGYLNNAHNDYLQLVIEAGLFALVGLGIFMWAIIPRLVMALKAQFRTRRVHSVTVCAIAVAMALLHSVVDYPLRTAALSVVFALSCGALLSYSAQPSAGRRRREPSSGDFSDA